MRSKALNIMIPFLLGSILLTGAAGAQGVDYDFHWAPCPIVDGDGLARPEAVAYEVYVVYGNGQIRG